MLRRRVESVDARQTSESAMQRAVLVNPVIHPAGAEDALGEFRLLVTSAGAEIAATVSVRRGAPHPATYLGKGKIQEIGDLLLETGAKLVVVNQPLTPIQERNLEHELCCRVLDRTGLILDIFAQRASSHEGKLQVELAQLRHLSTRLVRGWTHLERQKGGIGLRGPGETQLETDRRLIGGRIKSLNRRLQRVSTQRQLRRKARRKIPIPTVSMVGYTNAGKSSLFNALTDAGVYAVDKLFATLDPTMRRIELDGFGPAILSDTVGFIRDLPHNLIKAFHATLEEVREAELLIHVIDVTDAERTEHIKQVGAVLDEIGAAGVPSIRVYNKIDCLPIPPRVEYGADGSAAKIWLSAHTDHGIDLLKDAISAHLGKNRLRRKLRLPLTAAKIRAAVYQRQSVLSEQVTDNGEWRIELEISPADVSWLEKLDGFQAVYWC